MSFKPLTEEKKNQKVVIIGGGPTGLGAALRLQDLGCQNWKLFDTAAPGGLACSFVDSEGFTWDVGGHVIFSHFHYFDDAMKFSTPENEWLAHQRESWVFVENSWVPYPFQNNIHRLPDAKKAECFEGLVDVYRKEWEGKPKNFDEHFTRQMGDGIAKLFMRPYNFKVWAIEPKEMSTEWVGERVAGVDLKSISRSVCLNEDKAGWGPNNKFLFPMYGGTGGIWTRLANKLDQSKLFCGKDQYHVKKVDAGKKQIEFIDGTVETYDALISTIAFDDLCNITTGPFDTSAWPEIASQMKYSATNVVGIGLKGVPPPHLKTMCWMYFPEDNCPFYRVTVFSNYSPHNAPEGCWSLMLEISESKVKPVNQETLMEECIQGCINTTLITEEDRKNIVSKWHKRFPKGYPTPFVGRNELLMRVQPTLKEHNIYSRGRFGGWKYEVANQDHSMQQGVEAVEEILGMGEELTYWKPDVINDCKTTEKYPHRRLSLLKPEDGGAKQE